MSNEALHARRVELGERIGPIIQPPSGNPGDVGVAIIFDSVTNHPFSFVRGRGEPLDLAVALGLIEVSIDSIIVTMANEYGIDQGAMRDAVDEAGKEWAKRVQGILTNTGDYRSVEETSAKEGDPPRRG